MASDVTVKIMDDREEDDFKGITFSKYDKNKAKLELLKAIRQREMERALHWTAELICAGHFLDLWELILLVVGKYIHIANPKLPTYIARRFDRFKTHLRGNYAGHEIDMRNDNSMRALFTEVVGMLVLSKKKPAWEPLASIKDDEFNVAKMATKLRAPNVEFASQLFQVHDPKELLVPMNELAFHVQTANRNQEMACYWLEWLLAYDTMAKRKKEPCIIQKRPDMPVPDKSRTDMIWLVWELLLAESQKRPLAITHTVMQALLELFALRYAPAVKQRRRHLLYFAVALLTENVSWQTDLLEPSQKEQLEFTLTKKDVVYKAVKTQEVQFTEAQWIARRKAKEDAKAAQQMQKRLEKSNAFATSLSKLKAVNANDNLLTR